MIRSTLLSLLFISLGLASPAPGPASAPTPKQKVQEHEQIVRMQMRRKPAPTATDTVQHGLSTLSQPSSSAVPFKSNMSAFLEDLAYGIELWIGNPPQSVTLDFDTGSSETWVDPPCTEEEPFPTYEQLCRSLGTFVPEQSQSLVDVNGTCPPKWIFYGSGAVYVRYYKDVISFTDPYDFGNSGKYFSLERPVQFGLAVYAEGMPSGIAGFAYGRGFNQNYSTILDEMHAQGLIKDKDFSVALGSVDETNGELVFGGIDTRKFTGPLHGIPLSSQLSRMEDGYYRYWINVTSISVSEPGSCVSIPLTEPSFEERFLPDTGTTLTYLPEDVFDGLLEFFPTAEFKPGFGYVLDCNHVQDEGTINFGFGDFTIQVPYSDFIFKIPAMPEGEDQAVCVVGAVPSSDFFILGDTFMRSAYVVFRQGEHKVYLAQFEDCGTKLVSSRGDISDIKGECGVEASPPERYGFPPPAASTSTKHVPWSSCTAYSTAHYTSHSFSTPEARAGRGGHSNTADFPRPAVQTGRGRGNRKPPVPSKVTSHPKPIATLHEPKPNPSVHRLNSQSHHGPGHSNSIANIHEPVESTSEVLKTEVVVTTFTFDAVTLPGTTFDGTTITMTLSMPNGASALEVKSLPEERSTPDCDTETSTSDFWPTTGGSSWTASDETTTSGWDTCSSSSDSWPTSTGSWASEESPTSLWPPSSTSSYDWSSWSSDGMSGTSDWGSGTSTSSDEGPPETWLSVLSSATSDEWPTDESTTYTPWVTSTASSSLPTSTWTDTWTEENPTDTGTSYESGSSTTSYASWTDTWTEAPTEITIPVTTPETVIIELASTTFTIIDGYTVTSQFPTYSPPASSWTAWSSDYTSWSSAYPSGTVSDEYDTSMEWTPADSIAMPTFTVALELAPRNADPRAASDTDAGCRTTPCLRAMQERSNMMRAEAFCRELEVITAGADNGRSENKMDPRMMVPHYLQPDCLSSGTVASIQATCKCLEESLEAGKGLWIHESRRDGGRIKCPCHGDVENGSGGSDCVCVTEN